MNLLLHHNLGLEIETNNLFPEQHLQQKKMITKWSVYFVQTLRFHMSLLDVQIQCQFKSAVVLHTEGECVTIVWFRLRTPRLIYPKNVKIQIGAEYPFLMALHVGQNIIHFCVTRVKSLMEEEEEDQETVSHSPQLTREQTTDMGDDNYPYHLILKLKLKILS